MLPIVFYCKEHSIHIFYNKSRILKNQFFFYDV